MHRDALGSFLDKCVDAVEGVSGINTLQLPVCVPNGNAPAFPGRAKAGVSGIAIRDYGVDFTRSLTLLRAEMNRKFAILAMGGVMTAEDVRHLMRLGANAVHTATAASQHPAFPAELDRDDEVEMSDEAIRVLAVLERQPDAAGPDGARECRPPAALVDPIRAQRVARPPPCAPATRRAPRPNSTQKSHRRRVVGFVVAIVVAVVAASYEQHSRLNHRVTFEHYPWWP